MKIQPLPSLLLGTVLFTTACGSAAGLAVSSDGDLRWSDGARLGRLRAERKIKVAENGLHINGERLLANGMSANGMSANGLDENGLHINGITLDSEMFENLRVDGSQLSAYSAAAGRVLTGVELSGATLEVTSAQPGGGDAYLLRIDGVELDAGAVTPDVYLYSMSYRRPGDAAWRSVCIDAGGAPEPAIPIEGFQWDLATGRHRAAPGVVVLACRSGAIGSCASWGYRPWIPELVPHHQACIFMKRADYCGDGRGYTVNGTKIDIYDHHSPAIQTQMTGWPLEAHWGTEGASCVSSRRHPEIPFSGQCLRDGALVTLPACGEAAGPGDLLSNRAQPRIYR